MHARPLVLALLLLTGCAAFLSAPAPMATLHYPAATHKPARCLLVLLPGRGDHADDFARHGLIAAVQQRHLAVDLVAADATIGYYAKRTLFERLQTDVLAPARQRGYEQVWLAGASMGGLGALLMAKKDHGIHGVLLLGPFLGDEDVVAEVAAAGGVRTWTPRQPLDPDDYQRDLWRWLQGMTQNQETAPELYLGYGEDDRFVAAHRLLAAALPPGQVLRAPGGHDWPTWAQLFARFLDLPPFVKACGPISP